MIVIPVSVGEVLDKISILEIKIEMIKDKNKRANCLKEYKLLKDIAKVHDLLFSVSYSKLKAVNKELWYIEDELRKAEVTQDFGNNFIQLTRKQYRANDFRSNIKRQINIEMNSVIVEEKDYIQYQV